MEKMRLGRFVMSAIDTPISATSLASPPSVRKRYSMGEEIANSVTHGIGCALAVVALVLLVLQARRSGEGVHLAAAYLMGVPLIVEYLFSTLYHAIQEPRAKSVLRVFDHACIYLLIAGSYAPFALITLAGHGGQRLFFVVCALAVAGAVAEAFLRERQPGWITPIIYLAMGWAIVFHITDVYVLLPTVAFQLLLAGGLCYSAGVAFYAMPKVPYMHSVFHLLVLAGSVCITLSALLFVV